LKLFFIRCVLTPSEGRAIAQAVSRRLPTAVARVQTRVWSCGISWWTKVALGQVFSENFGFPCHSIFHLFLHNHLHYHPRLAQYARSGRSTNSLTNTHTHKKNSFRKAQGCAEHGDLCPGFLLIYILVTHFRSLYVQHLCALFTYLLYRWLFLIRHRTLNILLTMDNRCDAREVWKPILFHRTFSPTLVLAVQRNSARRGLREFMVSLDEKLHKQLGLRPVIW
jgi:hypothetical protein